MSKALSIFLNDCMMDIGCGIRHDVFFKEIMGPVIDELVAKSAEATGIIIYPRGQGNCSFRDKFPFHLLGSVYNTIKKVARVR